jgi:uncharacterized protein (TIGR03066 family)
MKKIVLAVAVLLMTVVVSARAQEGKGKEGKGVQVTSAKLVGVWVPVHTKLPAGTSINIEFRKDGKLKVFGMAKVKGKDQEFKYEGSYKIVEGGFVLTAQGAEGEVKKQTITITQLTDQEMATRNEQGVEGVYKRK